MRGRSSEIVCGPQRQAEREGLRNSSCGRISLRFMACSCFPSGERLAGLGLQLPDAGGRRQVLRHGAAEFPDRLPHLGADFAVRAVGLLLADGALAP